MVQLELVQLMPLIKAIPLNEIYPVANVDLALINLAALVITARENMTKLARVGITLSQSFSV